jgi:hypothetical protein
MDGSYGFCMTGADCPTYMSCAMMCVEMTDEPFSCIQALCPTNGAPAAFQSYVSCAQEVCADTSDPGCFSGMATSACYESYSACAMP